MKKLKIYVIPTENEFRINEYVICETVNALVPKGIECGTKIQEPTDGLDTVYYEMYFTSNEKIKKGNWFLDPSTNKIEKHFGGSISSSFEKIVMTTNKKLKFRAFDSGVFSRLEYNLQSPNYHDIYYIIHNKLREVEYSITNDGKFKLNFTNALTRDNVRSLIFDVVAESFDWSRENGNITSIGIIQKRFLNNWLKEHNL